MAFIGENFIKFSSTSSSPVTRTVFHPADEASLKYLTDDNQKIEPEWYCPIVPMVLVNGAQGIGTGWSTNVSRSHVSTLLILFRIKFCLF